MKKGYSIHIGLNKVDPKAYDENWDGTLQFAKADAKAMKVIAELEGYSSSATLFDEMATMNNLFEELEKCKHDLKTGDTLFLTYSGHGGSLPDINDEDEFDRLDETWCLYDGEIIDDELFIAFSKLAEGVKVIVLSDSCHSGTVVKNAAGLNKDKLLENMITSIGYRSKSCPISVSKVSYLRNKAAYDQRIAKANYDKQNKQVNASVMLLSGCQDNQDSYEGWGNGEFTSVLMQIYNGGRYPKDYVRFYQRIISQMPDYQTPNLFYYGKNTSDLLACSPFKL